MPSPPPLVSTVLCEIGPRPPDDELEYVLAKVYAAASPLRRKGLVDKLVSALTLQQAVIDHERGGGVSGDVLNVVTAPHAWRKYAANIVNRRRRKMDLPDITVQQLLDLAEEYQSQSGEREVGRAAAHAQAGPEVAAAEQSRTCSTDEPALERGAAAVDAAAAAERDHAAGEASSPSPRARRARRGRTFAALDSAASRGTPSPTHRAACASPSA